MNLQNLKIFCIAILGGVMLSGTTLGAVLASDSSGDAAYVGAPDNVVYGLDGGTGFQEWFKYWGGDDSLQVVDANEPLPPLKPESFYCQEGRNITRRTIDTPLSSGDIFSISLDATPDSTGSIGLYLYDNGYDYQQNRQLYFAVGASSAANDNWTLFGTTQYDTGIPRGAGPLTFELTDMGGISYSVTVTSEAVDEYGAPLYSFTQWEFYTTDRVNGLDRFKLANNGTGDGHVVTYDDLSVTYAGSTPNAYDDASDAVYLTEGSVEGLNGGTGFGDWEAEDGILFSSGTSTGGGNRWDTASCDALVDNETIFIMRDSTDNDRAGRFMDSALTTDDAISIVMKRDSSDPGSGSSWIGFHLYNSDNYTSNQVRVFFGDLFDSGLSEDGEPGNWCIWDKVGEEVILDTGLPADDTPIRVTIAVESDETYDLGVEVWDEAAGEFGPINVFKDITMTGTGLGALNALRVDNMADRGNLLFNSIIVEEKELPDPTPEPIPGDANGDSKVDGSDVTILAGNWQKGVSDGLTAKWEEGDFNGDGKVDGSDVTILAGNWQQGVTATATAVPEPSVLILLVGMVLGVACFRRG